MSDDWDVDAYKSEFENEEHWQLRRNFMLAHKDKFPEDELVCLAQAFTNIEFMGCRYPDKTMIRIAELAKGVVEKFREQRKNSLKRTFVAASDAASAKVKGQTSQTSRGEDRVSSSKSRKIEQTDNSTKNTGGHAEQKSKLNTETTNSRVPKYGGVKTFNIKQNEPIKELSGNKFDGESNVEIIGDKVIEKSKGPLGDFVLILNHATEGPVSIIQRSAIHNKCLVRWDFDERVKGQPRTCRLFLNNHFIATSNGANMRKSKEHTAMVAIAKLRELYFGIRVKSKFFSDTTVTPAQLNSTSAQGGSSSQSSSYQLGEDNIGRKLMKLMGWKGGGLGSREQGIRDPISATLQVKREGLGLSKTNANEEEFKRKARDYIKAWMNSNSDQDLVFSSNFSVEERKIMHMIANNFSLKSKTYGKDPDRRLVISRKHDPWDIVKDLLKMGGNSEKYELLFPART